jgi:hypothetical protein
MGFDNTKASLDENKGTIEKFLLKNATNLVNYTATEAGFVKPVSWDEDIDLEEHFWDIPSSEFYFGVMYQSHQEFRFQDIWIQIKQMSDSETMNIVNDHTLVSLNIGIVDIGYSIARPAFRRPKRPKPSNLKGSARKEDRATVHHFHWRGDEGVEELVEALVLFKLTLDEDE